MKKRIISAVCAAAMVVSAAAVPLSESGSVFAPAIFASADSGTCGENVYWELSDGTLTISGEGNMEDYDGFVMGPWDSNRERITKVVIEDGVTSIGVRSFCGFINLSNIIIPNSVTSIEWNAFYDCSSLATITIPDSVTRIGRSAFEECSSLTNITIPNGVTSISDSTFCNCSSLINVTIPSSVTSIGNSAFYRLAEVYL